MFVSELYSYPRVQESFGQLAKFKEECKIVSTEKGETFIIPFYITKPSLLQLKSASWRGRLPSNIPSSFIGLFCSFQHFAQVKIIWKSSETGEIGCVQEEIVFKVIGLAKSGVVGVLEDVEVCAERDLDDLFPDDLIILDGTEQAGIILEQIKITLEENKHVVIPPQDTEQVIRSIVEMDTGYSRSLSVEIDDKSSIAVTIASIHLKKTKIHPGTQIFVTINLLSRVDLIKLKLECVEGYGSGSGREYLQPLADEKLWRDTVKEMKISPGCQDRLDLVIPIPPDLPQTNSCDYFTFQWELLVSFRVNQKDFDLTIPIEFYSLNFKFNK